MQQGYVARKGNRWYAVINPGLDPVTGREQRSWHAAGTTREGAEELARVLAVLSLERERRNTVTTRNGRLAAIHSLFGFLALHHPEHAASVQRVLAIPREAAQRNLVTYLDENEVDALLGSCELARWTGWRDHTMFALAIQTGLRISELASLDCRDVSVSASAHVYTIGKGRK